MSVAITVRNLDPETQRILKHRAVDHGRSFEAEIRAILDEVARGTNPASAADTLLAAASAFREAARGSGFALPGRAAEQPREVFA